MKTKGAGELKWTLGERRPLLEEGFGSEKMNGSKVSGSCRGVGNGGYARQYCMSAVHEPMGHVPCVDF